jgi:hypothetical protein
MLLSAGQFLRIVTHHCMLLLEINAGRRTNIMVLGRS